MAVEEVAIVARRDLSFHSAMVNSSIPSFSSTCGNTALMRSSITSCCSPNSISTRERRKS